MRKITTTLLTGIAVLTFTACGGSSSGGGNTAPLPSVDNSLVAEGQNSVGYYGAEVILGDHIAIGEWSYTYDGDTMYADLDNEGIAYVYDDYGWGGGTIYGISKDGKKITFDGGSVLTLYNATSNSCYHGSMLNMDRTEKLDIAVCKR